MRAAGALDEKLPAKARETLQIAAIHQLRPFLKGEYGDSFRRPAWEFIRARLQASTEATGETAIAEWVQRGGFPKQEGEMPGELAMRNADQIRKTIYALRPGPVTRTIRAVVREEARAIFQSRRVRRGGWCAGTCFDGTQLRGALLAGADLRDCSFIGANLINAHLESTNLDFAHLEGANLRWAHLEGANLSFTDLEGANLNNAHLGGADLSFAYFGGANLRNARLEGADLSNAYFGGVTLCNARLEGANLSYAQLEGADLSGALLEGANLSWAVYDDQTVLLDNWESALPEALAAARQRLRDLGARHVDDPDDDDA